MPANDEIKIISIDDIKPYENNPRDNKNAIDKVAKSIELYGFQQPIVIDRKNIIVAGHTRYMAALKLGRSKVPVKEAKKNGKWLTPSECKAYRIADNKTAEYSGWNDELLKIELNDLKLEMPDIDLAEITGFAMREVDSLLLCDEPVKESPAPKKRKTNIKPGDIFQLGRHRLMCGDSTNIKEVKRLTDGHAIDMILTDPPYCSGGFQEAGKQSGSVGTRGTEMIANDTLSTRGYQSLMKQMITAANAKMSYIFTDWRMWINLFDIVESCGFGVRNMIVWDKQSPGMGQGWRMQHELIMCGIRVKSPFNPKKAQGNVIQCGRTGNKNHATEKPVDLLKKIIEVNDLAKYIYDGFIGSGSTMLACEDTNRICYGMEIDPAYCQVTIDRWQDYTNGVVKKVD